MGWHPSEVMSLVVELPPEARFFARMQGEKTGMGFSQVDWLYLDMRNSVEAIRVMGAMRGQKNPSKEKAKREYREWKHFPGAESQKRLRARSVVDSLKKYVSGV